MTKKWANALRTLLYEFVSFDTKKKGRKYPSVVECIDDNMEYQPEVYEVLKKFRQSHPWRGTQGEMQFKLQVLNKELASVYKIMTPQLVFVDKFPVGPCCFPKSKPAVIMMELEVDGRYSVVCYMHEFGHCLQKDEFETCKWSINLFKRIFPKSFAKLEHHGHLLVKKK